MTKKIVKLAVIRDNENNSCPFGLPIPFGCKHAGNVIERMAPLDILENETEREKKKLSDANVRLLSWSLMDSTYVPTKCKFAAKIFEKQDVVECNFDDTAPGEGQGNGVLMAAPFYSQIFSEIGLYGLYSYPIGYYSDYNISRNLFYGQYSLQSNKKLENLLKEGDEKSANKKP